MNRTDRLLAIVLEMQGKGWRRAEDLAATFETSKRTIYRDIEALCEAGVPVVAVPGKGYALVEGFFLPPVRFTTDEASMLLLGADAMAQHFDAQYREAALSASRKVEAVLPEVVREEVRFLQESLHFVTSGTHATAGGPEMLRLLRRAIIECRTLRFHYHSRHRSVEQSSIAQREADPYGLTHVGGAWYVQAYCHQRAAMRHFRLDRIADLEVLETTFTRLPRLVVRQPEPETRTLVIRVLFDNSVSRWVQESRFFYVAAEEQRDDGLEVTLRVRHEGEALQWILSWGRHARVLEPESLCRRLAEEAEAMQQMYGNAQSLLT